jgi:hypothetical protein
MCRLERLPTRCRMDVSTGLDTARALHCAPFSLLLKSGQIPQSDFNPGEFLGAFPRGTCAVCTNRKKPAHIFIAGLKFYQLAAR